MKAMTAAAIATIRAWRNAGIALMAAAALWAPAFAAEPVTAAEAAPQAATPGKPPAKTARTQPAVGEMPPDFLGLDVAGKPVKVSDYRGKLVVISFWASWCGPCLRELPMLSGLQSGVGREHLQVVAINLNEPKRDFEQFLRLNPALDMRHIRDPGTIARQYGVTVVPNLFVIDQRGAVAQVHRGYSTQKLQQFARDIAAMLPPQALRRPAGTDRPQ